MVAIGVAAALVALAGRSLLDGPPLHHAVETTRLLQAFDLDGNGLLDAAELDGRDPPGQSWADHDLDDDGAISARELEIAMDELDPRWLLRIPD